MNKSYSSSSPQAPIVSVTPVDSSPDNEERASQLENIINEHIKSQPKPRITLEMIEQHQKKNPYGLVRTSWDENFKPVDRASKVE